MFYLITCKVTKKAVEINQTAFFVPPVGLEPTFKV